MNKQILTMAMLLSIALTSMNTFAQANKKSEKARKEVKEANKDVKEANENLIDANQDLLEASIDSTAEYVSFKKDAEATIAENKRTIALLREKKFSGDDKAIKQYVKKVESLEQQNNDLQKSINSPNNAKSSRWESFKREYKHDMKELGQALKDLAVDNEK